MSPQRYVFPMQEENQFLEDLFEDLWEAFNTYAFIDELTEVVHMWVYPL